MTEDLKLLTHGTMCSTVKEEASTGNRRLFSELRDGLIGSWYLCTVESWGELEAVVRCDWPEELLLFSIQSEMDSCSWSVESCFARQPNRKDPPLLCLLILGRAASNSPEL